GGDCRRTYWGADADDEIREHARTQLMLRIIDLGADRDTAGIGIDSRPDKGDLSVKIAAGKRVNPDADLLSGAERRTVVLGNVRQHPLRIEVNHRIGRRRVARLHIESGRGIPSRDPAADRAWRDERGIGTAL